MSGEVEVDQELGEDAGHVEDDVRFFTIDELSAVSAVPSRTIRYYQSKGVLPRPARRGRVAVYTDEHLDRLRRITSLQDRGLRLDAIRDVFAQMEDGTPSLQQWLGLDDALTVPWLDEEPVELSREALLARVGPDRAELLDLMVEAGLLIPGEAAEPDGAASSYVVLSPGIFEISLGLDREQIDFAVQRGALDRIRAALRTTCDELVTFFSDHAGEGFGGDVESMARQLRALRPMAGDAVRIVFGQEMQRALELFVASGGAEQFAQRQAEVSEGSD